MRTKFTPALLGVLIVPAFLNSAPAQTPDEVVEKHLAALGGRAALAKLTSRRATGTVTIATPNGDLAGPIELSLKAPNKSRAYITLDLTPLGASEKMTIEQKFDGTAGRATNSMQGAVEITGNQLENMRNNTFPTPLLTYKEAGIKLEVLPKEQVGGRDAVVLLATPKAGPPVRYFLDAETYMVVKAVTKTSSPELGDFESVSEPSDYRAVDGVKVPFAVKTTNPAQSLTIKLDKVEHNVALDDAIFAVKAPAADVTPAPGRVSSR